MRRGDMSYLEDGMVVGEVVCKRPNFFRGRFKKRPWVCPVCGQGWRVEEFVLADGYPDYRWVRV